MREISRTDGTDLKAIEGNIKNKFNWTWLQEEDNTGEFLSSWARKVDVPGKVRCIVCNDTVSYGSGGKKDLKRHPSKKEHQRLLNLKKTNQTLSSALNAVQEVVCSLPYGAPENVHSEAVCSSRRDPNLPKIVSFEDRKAHAEAFIVSFLAEHCLPFTMAPKLIEFAQMMSSDAKVLQQLSMSNATASYKLREGLGQYLDEELSNELKESFFSFNVDECFSNNYQKIFSMLVAYYSEKLNAVVIKHFKSESFTVVNARSLSDFVLKVLADGGIPLSNVVSVLSDSTNYMRGKVAGFETLLREKIPHLLDIDGDACHHAHNAAGVFCRAFGGTIESLCKDMRTELTFSTDLRDYVNRACEILGLNFRMPVNYTEHRWLSVLDAADLQLELLNANTILYFAWVKKEDKPLYLNDVTSLLKTSSDRSKTDISAMRGNCSRKKLTKAGQERKDRIVDKLFIYRMKTILQLNVYTFVLPIIKSFVLVMEQKEPMVHRLYDEIKNCMRTFLACFMRIEAVKKLTGKGLQTVDVKNVSLQKNIEDWNVGRATKKILQDLRKDDPIRETFETSLRNAFETCAIYLQKKYPLDNEVLRLLSSIDPKCQATSSGASAMKKLANFFPSVISEVDRDAYDSEVDKYHLLTDVPTLDGADGKPKQLDVWWFEVFEANELPLLTKLIKAAMSIFSGPMIEQSFSSMNEFLSKKTNRLKPETVAAIQSVRFDLKACKETSFTRYRRKNFLKTPVNRRLCGKFILAYRNYNGKNIIKRKNRDADVVERGIPVIPKKKKKSMHDRADEARKRAFSTK